MNLTSKKSPLPLFPIFSAVLLVSGFGIGLYATSRTDSQAINARASEYVDWNKVFPWKQQTDLSTLPGSGTLDSLNEYVFNSVLNRTLFRNNRMYTQYVPLKNDVPQWSSAGSWKEIENLSSLPGAGTFQSLNERVQDQLLVRTLFRDNKLYTQTVPVTANSIVWSGATPWKETTDLSSLPGAGTIQQLSEYFLSEVLVRHLFRGNRLFSQVVPSTNGITDWSQASAWNETLNLNTLPGTGDFQSITERIDGKFLRRTLIRDNKMYTQSVPIENGVPQWAKRYTWTRTTSMNTLPGSGSFEALSEYISGGKLTRTLLRDGHMYSMTVGLTNALPDWSKASSWKEQTNLNTLPGSGSFEALSEYVSGGTLTRTLLRNGHMYSMTVGLTNALPDWSKASSWKEQTIMTTWPGEGKNQLLSEYVAGEFLIRTMIRGGAMYSQQVPFGKK